MKILYTNGTSTNAQLAGIYSGVAEAQNRLVEVMREFQGSIGKEQNIQFEVDRHHTIEEFHQMLENASEVLMEAEQVYSQEKTKGSWGRIRLGFRNFAKNAKNANFFIALIPSEGNYLSVLSGGLKLICAVRKDLLPFFIVLANDLQAASRLGTIQLAIAKALEEIPSLLNDKGQILGLLDPYGVTETLHRRNALLSVAILEAVSVMIKWFQAKWAKSLSTVAHPRVCVGCAVANSEVEKLGRALLKPATAYEDEIMALLEAIRSRATEFNSHADISFQRISLQNFEQIKGLMVRMTEIHKYENSMGNISSHFT